MQSDLIWLVVIAVLNSVISAFYYLKIARTMFMDEASSSDSLTTSPSVKLALAVAVAGIIVVGIAPSPLLHAARDAAAVFGAQ